MCRFQITDVQINCDGTIGSDIDNEKGVGICDYFLGEGGGRGLADFANVITSRNPSLPLRASNRTPPVGRELICFLQLLFNYPPVTKGVYKFALAVIVFKIGNGHYFNTAGSNGFIKYDVHIIHK